MRKPIRRPAVPVRHPPRRGGGYDALRTDLGFAAGVLADTVRGRPFDA